MLDGSIDVLEGRIPEVGEVLIDPTVADQFGVGVGDELVLERPAGTWTVAGIGRSRVRHSEPLLVVPGFDRERIAEDYRRTTTLVDLPDDADPGVVIEFAAGFGGMTRFGRRTRTRARRRWRGGGSAACWRCSPSASSSPPRSPPAPGASW